MNAVNPRMVLPPEAGWRQLGLLILLAGIWSSSFMFIKIGVATIPPATMAAARLLLAAMMLTAIARARGYRLPLTLRAWAAFTFVGVMGNAVPFTLIAWGELEVDSGLAAILMGVMPVATALLAHAFVRDEPLTGRRAAGVLLGFSGTVLLVGVSALSGLGAQVAAQLAVVGGALCYAVTTVFVRRFANLPDMIMAAGAVTMGALAILPIAFLFESPLSVSPSFASMAAVAVLGVVSTGFAALVYFYLIRTVGAAIFSQVNFLTPAIGVAFGMVFLGESPGADAWSALALIVIGVWLVTRRTRPHGKRISG
ncbi:MAG TPA: EamA family transporter [Gammaproteobacteria bacterium]|nr:EamA family transporter [Gammaproteobacteria bacterium]